MIAQATSKYHIYKDYEKFMKTLLITAIGSFSAKTAIEAAKELGFRVIGCDIYPEQWISQALLVDRFYKAVPASDEESYMQFIGDVCSREHVDLILPLTDPEVDVLSARRDELPAQVALSHDDIITTCRDKMIFCTHMKGLIDAIPTSWVSETEMPDSFPVIVKPVRGRSSNGMRKLSSPEEYTKFRDSLRAAPPGPQTGRGSGDYIVQPYIRGSVVSVDIFRDPRNGYIFTLPREELLRTSGGAGTSVRIFHDEFIEDDCKLFAELFGIRGTVMLEFIVDETGYSWAMECNPRFSGGIGFSRAAGWDFAKAHLAVYADMKYDMPPDIGEMWIVKEYSEVVTAHRQD